MSHRDAVEAVSARHGVEMSVGTVAAIQRQVSRARAAPVRTAQAFARRQAVNHVDETGRRECGARGGRWVNVTPQVTAFRVAARRDAATAREVIGEVRDRVVTTDRHLGYGRLSGQRRPVSWAHLERDFQAMAERAGAAKEVGEALLGETKALFRLWREVKEQRLSRRKFRKLMLVVGRRVKEFLDEGSECAHAQTRRTCRRIRMVEAALWTFVRITGVEPTNNAAERALRRAVLWRRKSFGTQSTEGSRFVERILTVVTSLRQQGRDVLEYLTRVCAPALSESGSSGLLPDSS